MSPLFDLTKTEEPTGDDAPRSTRELLPPGVYQGECVEASFKTSRAGNDYLSVKWSVLGGPHAGTWVWDNILYAEPKHMPRLKHVLRRIGVDTEKGPVDIGPTLFLGATTWFRVTHEQETWQGSLQTRVRIPYRGYLHAEEAQAALQDAILKEGGSGATDEEVPF